MTVGRLPEQAPEAPGWSWALEHLRCPRCGGRLRIVALSADARDGVIGHHEDRCVERYPVISGVPRLVLGAAREKLARDRAGWFASAGFAPLLPGWHARAFERPADLDLVARFDREWRRFSAVAGPEQRRIFEDYFDLVPSTLLGPERLVVDAGCGAGRWAYELARRGPRVIAVDLGLSVEVAELNTRDLGRVACVQADVRALPLVEAAADLVCSLGVLHHVLETEAGVRELARVARPGGGVLLYLYYALDGRPAHYRALFRTADLLRRLASRLPQPILLPLAATIAAVAYLPLSRLSRGLRAVGQGALADALPLSYYADRSFRTMLNDSLDRFGTRLEKRFTREQVRRIMVDAGLRDVRISLRPPFWHAVASR